MTTQPTWQEVSALFDAAIDLPPEARAAYVTTHAATTEIAGEVLALLGEAQAIEAEDTAAHRLRTGGAQAEPPSTFQPLQHGSRLGAWQVGEVIGRGGMGEVYAVARVDGQYEQQAALKLVALESPAASARFHAERRMLAQLNHGGIARILDGGTTDDGRPYMVMEYVDGEPITAHCERLRLGFDARLDLFLAACDAVAHAHAQLIVHRDLKPGNLFVTKDGQVKLLDFGIAKVLSHAVDDLTRTQAVLTPVYASPEQLANRPVSTATDVYSLGVLLFQLLAGRTPVDAVTASIPEVIDKVLDGNPPKASQVAAQLDAPPVPPAKLAGDIDAILARCLRLEPQARYATVQALADDLIASREHRPINARKGDRAYRFRRFFRRYAWQSAAVGAVIVVLLGGVVVSAQYALAEQAARAQAESTARLAERRARAEESLRESLTRILARAQDTEGGDAVLAFLDAHVDETLAALRAGDPDAPHLLSAIGEVFSARGEPQRVVSALEPVLASDDISDELRASIALQVGSAMAYMRDNAGAAKHLRAAVAYFSAQPDRGYTAIQAASMLAGALGNEQGYADLAERIDNYLQTDAATRMDAQSGGFIYTQYGHALYNLERYDQAVEKHKQSIAAYESRKGPLSTDVLYALHNLAASQAKAGQRADALATRKRVVRMTEELQGRSLHLAGVKRALALSLINAGDAGEGLAMLDDVDALIAEYGDTDSSLQSLARGSRIRGLVVLERYPEALEKAQAHVALTSVTRPDDASARGGARYELANTLHAMGRHAEAMAELEKADVLFENLGAMRGAAMRRNDALRAKIKAAQASGTASAG